MLSICDGVDAVLRLASYIAQLPMQMQRSDKTLAEALEYLKAQSGSRFDQIVIAPDDSKDAAPRMLDAIIAEAQTHSDHVVILLPLKAQLRITPAKGLRVLHGPPFEAFDAVSGQALVVDDLPLLRERRQPIWRKVLRRGDKAEGDAAVTPPGVQTLPKSISAIAVQPLGGGVGGTTVAACLAVELARADPKMRICVIDLNLQFGNIGTYLNLAANSRVLDAYRGITKLDGEAFEICLQKPLPNLSIFGAPEEILPVDAINAGELRRLIRAAKEHADLVILDLPHLICDWSEAAFREVDCIFAVAALDVRSAQNARKLRGIMDPGVVASDRFFLMLNRCPPKPSGLWKDAKAEFELGCGTTIFKLLPEGGETVALACNAGRFLSDDMAQSPLKKALREIVDQISEAIPETPVQTAELK